ncbi:Thiamine repressible genes regulatory protein thi1 [Talaromyces islandicus]|uniref:Thiamine repressible genes regulatory protein thi1 n=1 Tax=Talaromyces islandicus TaxID=28573 RepID=A0A0U1M4N3_TALIS|nr:Thiamine repressible genes regulatory protein thi1 [Talaromyces islandicus]
MHSQPSPANQVTSHLLEASSASEGYRGDSSFNAHVRRVRDTLKNAASDMGSIAASSLGDDDPRGGDSTTIDTLDFEIPDSPDTSSSREDLQYPELENKTLPPINSVLLLLRLIQDEKQDFFLNMPVINETEFAEYCQQVYFAIRRYSLTTWAIVNVGLFYLFVGLKEHHYDRIGVTASDIDSYIQILNANIDSTINSFRLCLTPSVEACQAMSFLTMFYMRAGRPAMAWKLNSAGARMCIDMGFHRLPGKYKSREEFKKHLIFWHIYVVDKGLAFTLGRTPSIPHYDVSTELPSIPEDLPADIPEGPAYLYAAFLEFSVISGDMYIKLFSAAAQREPQRIRVERAEFFAKQLTEVNENIQNTFRDNVLTNNAFEIIAILLNIMTQCLVTIVYRIVPCETPNSHPLRCSSSCVNAARGALMAILRASETFGQKSPNPWGMLFSYVPFTSFIVLAGNTVAVPSVEDLTILWSALSSIEPVSVTSPSGKKLYDTCKAFYRIAENTVSRYTERRVTTTTASAENHLLSSLDIANPPSQLLPSSSYIPEQQQTILHQSFQLPSDDISAAGLQQVMTPRAWGAVMNDFDADIDPVAMASFIEPYLFFDRDMS